MAIHRQFTHYCPWSPMPHVAPDLKSQGVSNHGNVVVWCKQHPLAVGWQSQQTYILLLAVCFKSLYRVFLLIVSKRTVTSQFYSNATIIAHGLHVGFHFLPCIEGCIGGDCYHWHVLPCRVHRHEACEQSMTMEC